ncbi:MAG TPA: hypothetical protein VF550_00030 [Polyangia bacterium]|jgi:hypothetical protein
MRTIIKTVALTLALIVTVPTLVAAPQALAAETTTQLDRKKATEHLNKHQTYPATRAELLASCKNLMEFSDAEKKWFATHLPEGTYGSADEVLKAVFKK